MRVTPVLDAAACARLGALAPAAIPGEVTRVDLPLDHADVAAAGTGLGPLASATLLVLGPGAHRASSAADGATRLVFLDASPGGAARDPATRGQVAPVLGLAVDADHHLALSPAREQVVRLELVVAVPHPDLVLLAEPQTPVQTVESLRAAAVARGLTVAVLDPTLLDPRRGPLAAGTLLYAAATSKAAYDAERQLWQPGVATFHLDARGPDVVVAVGPHTFARAGLATPRTVTLRPSARDELESFVDWVGGLPAVVKVPGGELGVGTLRVDSLPALTSLLDLLWARGEEVRLMAYVDNAVHWRVIVVEGVAITAYRNPLKPNDFRSTPSADPADYGLVPSPEAARLAIEGTRASGMAFGGADVLEHPSGQHYLLEVNSPCYFPQAETFGKADVAGAMIEALLRRAGR